MKRIKLFLIMSTFWILLAPNAFAKSETEVIADINLAQTEVLETFDLLIDWSKKYHTCITDNNTFDYNKITLNINSDINYLLSVLDSSCQQAKSDLENMKSTLVDNYNIIISLENSTHEYLLNNYTSGTLGNIDVFLAIKNSAKAIESKISSLSKIYYEDVFNELKNQVNTNLSVDELLDLYDVVLSELEETGSIVNKIYKKLDNYQDIYNLYHLEDYNDLFIEYFYTYYNKLYSEYEVFVEKLENELQSRLDSKIKVIVDNTNEADLNSINNRNAELYNIINEIESIKTELENKFTTTNGYIKVAILKDKVTKIENDVLKRLDKAIDYTEEYLILVSSIDVIEASKNIVNLDKVNGIIIYHNDIVNSSKFSTHFTTYNGVIEYANLYNDLVGTNTKLQLKLNNLLINEYLIIVKGDIKPDAKIDITDIVNLCNQMFGKISLETNLNIAADMDSNGKIDITDVVLLCNKIMK